ncbi:polysaccharide pyruvyl transferase CsaB [candidate division WOR-1 bacterium RIFCSPHIGHO2_02_FULL_45_12]|nr:MAG: polysaccharide pyruvyl transferase CsaB [candidate division WOR-1 bacterium RIFCSPHIGHO2_02_FULL_45_12]
MKILISGYYGFGNLGDEAVLLAFKQGLKEQAVSVLPRKNPLAILGCNVFISGGGTLFQNATSNRSLLYYLSLIILAKLFRKKTVVLAQGFGPLKGTFYRWLTGVVLNKVDLITLRDNDSLQAVKELGVTRPPTCVTADPVAILDASPEAGQKLLRLEGVKKSDRPLLGVVVRPCQSTDISQRLAEAIDWCVRRHNFQPVFILFHPVKDMEGTAKVVSAMEEESYVVFREVKPLEMLSLISQFDLLIGMRLHSLIFAAINRVPMLALSYDPKVEAFMKTIDQPYLNIDAKNIIGALGKIILNKEKIKTDLAQKKKELRERAGENFEQFRRHTR